MIETTLSWVDGISKADIYLLSFLFAATFSLCIFFLFRSLIIMVIFAIAISLFLWFIGMLPSQHPPIPWPTFLIWIIGALIIIIPMKGRNKKCE